MKWLLKGKKILATHVTNNGLTKNIQIIPADLLEQERPNTEMGKRLDKGLHKQGIQVADKFTKRSSTSLKMREV